MNKVVYSSELTDFLHVLMFYDHFRDSSVSYFQPYANVEILFKLTFDLVSVLNILECLWNIYSANKQNISQNQIKHVLFLMRLKFYLVDRPHVALHY